MTKDKSVAVVDTRLAYCEAGRELVKYLEASHVRIIFASENPTDIVPDEVLLIAPNSALIANTGRLDIDKFWEAAYDYVDNYRNEIVGTFVPEGFLGALNAARNHAVPFCFEYNKERKTFVWR